MKKVLLVDANNILHRSYHALSATNLSGPGGEPTWAVHGLLVALARNLKQTGAERFILAFDSTEKTIRKSLHPFYKGTRKPAPEDLKSQLELGYNVISKSKLGACMVPGWEADDIIASAVNEQDYFYILSSDRDAHQLLANNVSIIKPEGGLFTKDDFESKYGFESEYYRYFAAFVGESSDNISGVSGIGEKTALKIIQTLNSSEKLLNLESNLDSLTAVLSSKQIGLLADGINIYLRNLNINALKRDLEVVKSFSAQLEPASYRPILESLNLTKSLNMLDSLTQQSLF